MRIIDKINAKSSKENRTIGQVKTTLGAILGAIAVSGLVVNPVGLLALSIGAIVCGVSASKNALKVGDDDTE
jgi:hypothetical protein